MALKEYEAGRAFPGVVGRTTDESSPAWPRPLRAAAGMPNVLWIVLDDTGFGQLGCYGSPIATPNFDALAAGGLLYNNMHTTALCFEFEPTGKPDFAQGKGSPGRAQLYVDSHLVAQAEFPVTTPVAFNPGGLTCGANPGLPVTPDYQPPFRFTGNLHTVTVDLSGDLITDTESEMRMAMSRQ